MKKGLRTLFGSAVISALALTACGTSDETAQNDGDSEAPPQETEEMYTVGATQIVEHPSLDAAYEGFKTALADNGFVEGENITYNFQSAQNDQNNTGTIANNFVADQVDLIFANSTPSALGALNATDEIPIIFTSVTDAVSAGLVGSMDEPGENITGVVDLHPESIEKSVAFLDTYFPDSAVGLIYNSGEANSIVQIDLVEEAMEDSSLEPVTVSVSTSAEVQQAAESLIGRADVFYVVTDNTVVSALESVVGLAEDQQIPLVVGEFDSVRRGGFMAYGFEYFDIGYESGEMAAKILSGEQTAGDIPAQYPQSLRLMMNETALEEQGIEWNDEWDELVEELVE
ncbi:ABC transporter substrate-binding protein [Desertibacillus haloalkaliphilus]|uniref:ABC transporter substrate-binding protein n=1 Tax=Desertibacillus haloalkaliphilus TaxID=1328930 RepID=UPI001C266C89|nr:ABC transporter substrate-binding protein [Desertibacillus haloalkaliphilus]MBU8904970.1 ABC transporter substrate-binding protein [Desertibacillus haloalkaliphilus]